MNQFKQIVRTNSPGARNTKPIDFYGSTEALYPARSNTHEKYPDSIDEIISQFGSFPAYTTILGICSDGLPLMVDLSSPKPGSIVVYGNSDQITIDVINSICLSGSIINPPDEFAVCMIAQDPDSYLDLIGYPNCQAMLAPYERSAGSMIMELSAIAEQRRYGRERGPAILLVLDDLFSFFSNNTDYGVFVNFKWLVNFGPKSMVWPVITIRNSNLSKFNQSMFSLFPFQISPNRKAIPSTTGTNQSADDFAHNHNFLSAKIGSKHLSFSPLVR